MSEGSDPASSVAEAVVEHHSRPSTVWLIPLVAILIGAFLVYRNFADRGPRVTISFESAEGLEAGKTKIKYKDVELGLVDSITLAEDFSHVIVSAELVKSAEGYLTENTRFWVVRARVAAGRVTGLGTLLSGAYIGVDPSTEGKRRREFKGLEVQPVVTSEDLGTLFAMRSTSGGSYQVGSPVYYRHIRVGEVVSSHLSESGDYVEVQAFVQAPHDDRVRTNTRFWNASGLDVSLGAEGVRIDTASVTSLLIGGIAFDTLDTLDTLEDAAEPSKGHVFPLYANRSEALSRTYAIKRRYLLRFEESVGGLSQGAPVVFQGIQIGRVLDVKLEFDPEKTEFQVPVLIEIEPERIGSAELADDDPMPRVRILVERGMRARLKSGNLITGQKEIELAMIKDAEPAQVKTGGRYPEFPTVPTPFDQLTSNVASIVERLNKIPFEDIGANLDQSLARLSATLENTEDLTRKLDEDVMPGITASAQGASELLSPTSTFSTELRRLLLELGQAARSLRLMADYLERHPESLVRGKEEEN
jgi:paraquat-inducible protein B